MIIDWILSALAAAGGIIIALLIAGFFVASAFTLLAAKILKVENVTFGRAMLATLLAGGATSFVLGLLFGPLFVVGAVLSTVGAYLVDSLVVKAIFKTSYGKGLLVTLLARVLAVAVAVVVILLVLGASFLSCGF
jgi:hypothetical protein